MSSRRCKVLIALFSLSLAAAPLSAFKDFVMPHAENAATYPSHDAHPTEHITAAIDLYNTCLLYTSDAADE